MHIGEKRSKTLSEENSNFDLVAAAISHQSPSLLVMIGDDADNAHIRTYMREYAPVGIANLAHP